MAMRDVETLDRVTQPARINSRCSKRCTVQLFCVTAAARMQIDAYFIQPSAASLQKYHFRFTAAGAGRRAYEMDICKSQRATIQLAPLPAPVFGRASRLVKNLGTWLTFAASLQYLRSENYCRSSFVVTFSAARCYYIHYT